MSNLNKSVVTLETNVINSTEVKKMIDLEFFDRTGAITKDMLMTASEVQEAVDARFIACIEWLLSNDDDVALVFLKDDTDLNNVSNSKMRSPKLYLMRSLKWKPKNFYVNSKHQASIVSALSSDMNFKGLRNNNYYKALNKVASPDNKMFLSTLDILITYRSSVSAKVFHLCKTKIADKKEFFKVIEADIDKHKANLSSYSNSISYLSDNPSKTTEVNTLHGSVEPSAKTMSDSNSTNKETPMSNLPDSIATTSNRIDAYNAVMEILSSDENVSKLEGVLNSDKDVRILIGSILSSPANYSDDIAKVSTVITWFSNAVNHVSSLLFVNKETVMSAENAMTLDEVATFTQFINGLHSSVKNDVIKTLSEAMEYLNEETGLIAFFKSLWADMKAAVSRSYKSVKTKATVSYDNISEAEGFVDTSTAIVSEVVDFVVDIVVGIKDVAVSTVRSAWKKTKSAVASVGNWFKGLFSDDNGSVATA